MRMTHKIPLFKIFWDDTDIRMIADVIASGMNWAEGPSVRQFEQLISEYIGSEYCVVFNSGTSALHAALLGHGIGRGDEVIVPSFTFIATANAPLFVGATPVFADIEDNTLGLDPDDVLEKITKKTKAIIPVHYGGTPCKIHKLCEIADDHNLVLIEDAAESFGAEIGGRKTGTFGDSAMFSFCQNKIITTGEGGALVTDSMELYEKWKLIRSHGRADSVDYFSSSEVADYIGLGYNFRMSNIIAALGCSQMEKVETVIRKRRGIAMSYSGALDKIRQIATPAEGHDMRMVYQLYSIRCEDRDLLQEHLRLCGIMSKIYFSPVHKTKFYQQGKEDYYLPVTEKVSSDILTIALYPSMSKENINYVIDSITGFYEGE